MIRLHAGAAQAGIMPEMGGGLASLRVAERPVLRPWSGDVADGPFALAMNLLAPFSNRISGGFTANGQQFALKPNLPPEPFPIHGDAFQRQWTVVDRDDHQARLALIDGQFGPFHYDAQVHYALSPDRLVVTLELINRAAMSLPYGLGFHPWFPRGPATRLQFKATDVWHEDARHLPQSDRPEAIPAVWNHSTLCPLPQTWINNGFAGWDGTAKISQSDDAVSLMIRTEGTGTVILYSPSASAGFFCFEPVTHPVDAHNLPGQPGLRTLAPGEGSAISMILDWG